MQIVKESSIIETVPMYEVDQPLFMNSVVQVETDLSPFALLKLNQSIEKKMGRIDTKRYGPRLLDIDILYYDDLISYDTDLIIPHPLIAERDFVLRPMTETAPDFNCPVSNKTIREMLSDLNSN
jgi:2-amino-4-hydroxy-6-hydroxymethyldihydropteridine diphosphokinase